MPTDIDEIEAWTLSRVVTTATALADSGEYHDFTDIDYALRFEHGWIQTRTLIDEAAMRMMLNERCVAAREKTAAASPEPCAEPMPLTRPVPQATPSVLRRLFGFRGRFARPIGATG